MSSRFFQVSCGFAGFLSPNFQVRCTVDVQTLKSDIFPFAGVFHPFFRAKGSAFLRFEDNSPLRNKENFTAVYWIDVTIRKRICFFQGSGYMGVVYPFAGTCENLLFSPSPHLSPVSLTGWERTDRLPISFFPFSQRVRMPSSVLRALFLSTGNHRIHKGGASS